LKEKNNYVVITVNYFFSNEDFTKSFQQSANSSLARFFILLAENLKLTTKSLVIQKLLKP